MKNPKLKRITLRQVMLVVLSFLIPAAASAWMGRLINVLVAPLSPLVLMVMQAFSLTPAEVWQARVWQAASFLLGLIFSLLTGIVIKPLMRRLA